MDENIEWVSIVGQNRMEGQTPTGMQFFVIQDTERSPEEQWVVIMVLRGHTRDTGEEIACGETILEAMAEAETHWEEVAAEFAPPLNRAELLAAAAAADQWPPRKSSNWFLPPPGTDPEHGTSSEAALFHYREGKESGALW